MQIKLKTLIPVAFLIMSITLAGCSSSNDSNTTTTKAAAERTTGFSSPDGIFVGPRGKSNSDGTPLEIGTYGNRKKHKGDLSISKDGTQVTGIDVEGVIYVNANNVKVSNFTAQRVTQKPGKSGMVLEDGTINGNKKNNDGIQWSNFTVRRTEITGSFDGIKAQGEVVIEDSYIHDLHAFKSPDAGAGGYSHNDCVQVSAGSNILIERNWFDNCGFNSAVFIDPDQGKISNVTVRHNYLNGGGITLYAIASRSADNGIPTNVTISNNVFGDTHEFDYATIAQGISFTNNVRTNGELITPRPDPDNT